MDTTLFSSSYLLQFFLNGLISGSIYGLVAVGFAITYNTNKFVNFAHGAIVLVGSYGFFAAVRYFNFSMLFGFLFAVAITVFVGWLIFIWLFNPLQERGASNSVKLLASIALLTLLQSIFQILFTSKAMVLLFDWNKSLEILENVFITPVQIIIISVVFLVFVLVAVFFKKSTLGVCMRAVADNNELACITGIDEKKIRRNSFLFSSLLAGIAGALLIMEQGVSPQQSVYLIIKGFASAVIGGLDFVFASLVGAYLLGFVENYSVLFVDSIYKVTVSFTLLFVFLLFRPQGIFSLEKK